MRFLVVLSLLLSLNSLACKTYEAQVSLKVLGYETDSLTTCKAIIDSNNIERFNAHIFCPLDLGYVIRNGVDFPLVRGHECEVPTEINGVLVQIGNKIILE